MTKARCKDFELQSSELWGNTNDLSAQLEFQSIGFETKSVQFFLLKVSTLQKKSALFGAHLEGDAVGSRFYKMLVHACITTKCTLSSSKMLLQNDRESRAKNGLGVRMP